MNAELHIHRFEARHRVRDDSGRKLALDAQAQLLDGELEAALARVSGRDELVLLRRLSARVRLSARHSDRDNARAWGDALALSLEQALRRGGNDVLRFASPPHALRAFAADALRVDEACYLQPPRAVADHPVYQIELDAGRNDVRLVLQPVARADLDQFNVSG